MKYLPFSVFPGLLLCAVLATVVVHLPTQAEAARILELEFHHALFEFNDRPANLPPYPISLHLGIEEGTITKAALSSPFFLLRGGYYRTHEGRDTGWSIPDTSNLVIENGTLTGSLHGTIDHRTLGGPLEVAFTVNATITGAEVSGSYSGTLGPMDIFGSRRGTEGDTAIAGPVTGTLTSAPSPSGEQRFALTFYHSTETDKPVFYEMQGAFLDGSILPAEMSFFRYTPHASDMTGGVPLPILSEAGHWQETFNREVNAEHTDYNVASPSGTLTTDQLDLAFSLSPAGRLFTGDGTASALVIGSRLFGTWETGSGQSFPFLGRLLPARPTPDSAPQLPAVTALSPSGAGPDSFSPEPYFTELTGTGIRDRIRAALRWMRHSPALGPFHADETTLPVGITGDKQYDNGPLNVFGVVRSMSVLADMETEPATLRQIRRMAERGGYFGIHNGDPASSTFVTCYKTMGWWNLWMGEAFLDLYEMTGNDLWLDRATLIADHLADLQKPSGAWSYIATTGGYADGQSCSRDDRSADNDDLASSEHLHFLGRLRHLGVSDYRETEDRAFAWYLSQEDIGAFFTHLLDIQRCSREETLQPILYANYLLKYRDTGDYDIDHVRDILAYIESEYTDWSARDPAQTNGFTPSVSMPGAKRTGAGLTGGNPMGMGSAGAAAVYALFHQKTGDPLARKKASTLLHATLSAQDMATGELHHSGLLNLEDDPALRSPTTHRYTAYQAYMLGALEQARDILATTDAPGAASVAITTPVQRARLAENLSAKVRIERIGEDFADPLTVHLAIHGPAVPDVDYSRVSETVTIPSGAFFVEFPVTPLASTGVVGESSLRIDLVAHEDYHLSDWQSVDVVLELLEAPTIRSTAPSNQTRFVGEPFRLELDIIGSPVPLVTVDGLPAWLAFDGDRILEGTPGPSDANGIQNTITITATNSSGSDTLSFPLSVVFAQPGISILSPLDDSVVYADETLQLEAVLELPRGILHEETIEWTSDMDGVLANSLAQTVDGLSVGYHTLTLTVTNGGSVSNTASRFIEVRPPLGAPRFLLEPQPVSAYAHTSATFTTEAEGLGSIAYQWLKNGEILVGSDEISGTTSPTLRFHDLRPSDDAMYSLRATNASGVTVSAPARLHVLPLPPVYLHIDFGNNFASPGGNWYTLAVAGNSSHTGLPNFLSGTVSSPVGIEVINTSGSGLQISGASDTWGARQLAPQWASAAVLNDRMWINAGDSATLRIHSLEPGARYDIEIASSFAAGGSAGSTPGLYQVEGGQGFAEGLNAASGESLGTSVEWTSRGPDDGGDANAAEGWMIWPSVPADAAGEIRVFLSSPFGSLSRISLNAMRLISVSGTDAPEEGSIEEWRQLHFGTSEPTGNAADTANPSGDGIPNFLKFALGMNPLVAASGEERRLLSVRRSDDQLQLDIRIPADLSRPGIRYQVLHSLDFGAWQPIAEARDNGNLMPSGDQPEMQRQRIGDLLRLSFPPPSLSRGFYKLRVEPY